MLRANTPVYFTIPVGGERIAVPGITTCDSFIADRPNRNTGSMVPTEFVEVMSYHDIPANRSRTGQARKYYKHQRQSVYFMTLRRERVPELDDLTTDELWAKVEQSAGEIQTLTTGNRVAEAVVGFAPKADFRAPAAPIVTEATPNEPAPMPEGPSAPVIAATEARRRGRPRATANA